MDNIRVMKNIRVIDSMNSIRVIKKYKSNE